MVIDEVSVQRSGPADTDTSIEVRPGGVGLGDATKALAGLGIGVAA